MIASMKQEEFNLFCHISPNISFECCMYILLKYYYLQLDKSRKGTVILSPTSIKSIFYASLESTKVLVT